MCVRLSDRPLFLVCSRKIATRGPIAASGVVLRSSLERERHTHALAHRPSARAEISRPKRERTVSRRERKFAENSEKRAFGLFWQFFSPNISAGAPPRRGGGPNSHHCHRSFPAFSLVVVAAARVIPGRKNIIAPIDRSQRALSDGANRSHVFVKSDVWGTFSEVARLGVVHQYV